MKKLIETKKLFIAKIGNVHNIPNYDGTGYSPEFVSNSLGYRLIEQTGKDTYVDVLLGVPVYADTTIPDKEGALIVKSYKRPLYRYCRSLRVIEKDSVVQAVAKYIAENYNKDVFTSKSHTAFYDINNIVRFQHINDDNVVIKTSKSDLPKRLFGIRNSYDVDELFVVKTNIIVNMSKDPVTNMPYCDEASYKYTLCARKWNGKFEDILTKNEIDYFKNDVKVGDVIVSHVRPLFRYAKSLHLKESLEDVKTYAEFVDKKFNSSEYLNNHTKFNEINEVVRSCHNKEKEEESILA